MGKGASTRCKVLDVLPYVKSEARFRSSLMVKPEIQKRMNNAKRNQLKGLVHDNAHARRLSLLNKFVGSTKFEIAITGTITENPSFYSDIRRFGWSSLLR